MLTEERYRIAQPESDQSFPIKSISFLELEITGFCQLKCKHCYADSSPEYTNLVHVTSGLWEFSLPGASLGTSWYSADSDRHADVTGGKGSHAQTRANIVEALRRGIPIRAGIVEVVDGQDTATARDELLPWV